MILKTAEEEKSLKLQNAIIFYYKCITGKWYCQEPFKELEKLGIQRSEKTENIVLECGYLLKLCNEMKQSYENNLKETPISVSIQTKRKTREKINGLLESIMELYKQDLEKLSKLVSVTFRPTIIDDELFNLILNIDNNTCEEEFIDTLRKRGFVAIDENLGIKEVKSLIYMIHSISNSLTIMDFIQNEDLLSSVKKLNDIYIPSELMEIDCSYEDLNFSCDKESAFDEEVKLTLECVKK